MKTQQQIEQEIERLKQVVKTYQDTVNMKSIADDARKGIFFLEWVLSNG